MNFDDTIAATEPVLSDDSILAIVREDKVSIEVEDDEEEGNNTIKVNDNCQEKPTPIQLRSATETLLDFSLFMKSRRGSMLHNENFGTDRKRIIQKFKASFN